MTKWKLVPVEPTEEMLEVGYSSLRGMPSSEWHSPARETYEAMLSAAPQPDVQPAIYPEEAREMGLEEVPYYTHPPAADVQPVAWMNKYQDGHRELHNGKDNAADYAVPVYMRPPTEDMQELERNEQYQMQMTAISTASLGYWKEGDEISPEYDTVALRDVAELYGRYKTARTDAQDLVVALREIQIAAEDWSGEDVPFTHRQNYRDFAQHAKEALAKWEGKYE